MTVAEAVEKTAFVADSPRLQAIGAPEIVTCDRDCLRLIAALTVTDRIRLRAERVEKRKDKF